MDEQTIDQQLVEKVQRGDKRAFDVLVRKYQNRIVNVIGRYIKDSDEVYDVAQEAFIKAYRAIPKFRGDSAFYTWLYRIAINTSKNFLVAQGRRPPDRDVDMADAEQYGGDSPLRDVSTPERELSRDEVKKTIFSAIDNLPEELKTAITLRELDGLSYEDIAAVMECPVGTVRSRIFRAREAIDKKLKELSASAGIGE
jgi:RNA polymerase sigma-70 factor (ECF subfamily)